MDYPTVVRCYLEIKAGDYHCEDVCALLLEEFSRSKDLSSQESKLLIEAVNKWQNGNAECKSEQITLIERVLFKKEGFKLEFAKFADHRLHGGSKNEF